MSNECLAILINFNGEVLAGLVPDDNRWHFPSLGWETSEATSRRAEWALRDIIGLEKQDFHFVKQIPHSPLFEYYPKGKLVQLNFYLFHLDNDALEEELVKDGGLGFTEVKWLQLEHDVLDSAKEGKSGLINPWQQIYEALVVETLPIIDAHLAELHPDDADNSASSVAIPQTLKA
eukprot:gene8909-406_t